MFLAMIVLAVTAFVVVPTADAAICAPEAAAAHAPADHEADSGDHDGRGGEHGVCAHGHCHHLAVARPDGAATSTWVVGAAELGLALDDMRASFAPEGLIRPPRG
jgi:hypothetical protein